MARYEFRVLKKKKSFMDFGRGIRSLQSPPRRPSTTLVGPKPFGFLSWETLSMLKLWVFWSLFFFFSGALARLSRTLVISGFFWMIFGEGATQQQPLLFPRGASQKKSCSSSDSSGARTIKAVTLEPATCFATPQMCGPD